MTSIVVAQFLYKCWQLQISSYLYRTIVGCLKGHEKQKPYLQEISEKTFVQKVLQIADSR